MLVKTILLLALVSITAHYTRALQLGLRKANFNSKGFLGAPWHQRTLNRSASVLAVSPLGSEVAVSILAPSALGYWKREYGVSYGYGGSIALAAYICFRDALTPLGRQHALLHIVYGVRLSAFLLFREVTVPKFKEATQRIDELAPRSRLARTPFIASCAALYWLMSFPLFITSSLSTPLVATSLLSKAVNSCLKIAAFGLAVQIIGDTQKYVAKKCGGEATLVTGGLYRYLRHPNYTGELVLWTFSSLAGILAASAQKMTPRLALLASGSVLGSLGIAFILALAATGLEKRQYERYGQLPAYTSWVQGSIPGLLLPKKKPAAESDPSKKEALSSSEDIMKPRISNELEVEEGL